MTPREVPQLVGDYRLPFIGRQRLHEREPDDQIVAVRSEDAQAGHLNHAGIHVGDGEDDVDSRRFELAADLADELEKRRHSGFAEHDSLGRLHPDPQGAQHRHDHDQQREGDLEDDDSGVEDEDARQRHETDEYRQDIAVAEQRERDEATPVYTRPRGGLPLEPLHQRVERCVVHGRKPVPARTLQCTVRLAVRPAARDAIPSCLSTSSRRSPC